MVQPELAEKSRFLLILMVLLPLLYIIWNTETKAHIHYIWYICICVTVFYFFLGWPKNY